MAVGGSRPRSHLYNNNNGCSASLEFHVEWQGELAVKGHITVLLQMHASEGIVRDDLATFRIDISKLHSLQHY